MRYVIVMKRNYEPNKKYYFAGVELLTEQLIKEMKLKVAKRPARTLCYEAFDADTFFDTSDVGCIGFDSKEDAEKVIQWLKVLQEEDERTVGPFDPESTKIQFSCSLLDENPEKVQNFDLEKFLTDVSMILKGMPETLMLCNSVPLLSKKISKRKFITEN